MTELWLVDLDAAGPALAAIERATPRLAVDDRSRAVRLTDPLERRRRLSAYTALRIALERVAGPSVRGVRLARSAGGKPHLPGGGPAFNLSHAGGMGLIGVAAAGPIGDDVERARAVQVAPRRRLEIVAAGAGLAGARAKDAQDDDAFLRAWARLEAFAKAHGEGVAHVLRELRLRTAAGRDLPAQAIATAARGLARGAGLEVRDLGAPRGTAGGIYAAVAVPAGAPLLRLRRFPDTEAGIARLIARRP